MRWTKRERTVGEVVAVAVLAVGVLSVTPGEYAARVQAGMTPAEVESALGTAGRPDHATEYRLHGPRDINDLWSEETLTRNRAINKGTNWLYRDYEIGSCAVAVAFHGPEGDERVTSVDAYRAFRPGWHVVPWLAGAVAAGLLAAEWLRWRRRNAQLFSEPAPSEVGALAHSDR
ncbi:MAG TPA: hypothetical protein VD866_30615 [Urbifossiella sp.]|nr:hypothetical protein [Urbifossiella sp.]